MNEEGTETRTTEWSPVTLPEDANYADLKKAHEEGADEKGRTEEELYPAQQAKADSFKHYEDEVKGMHTFYDANQFKTGRLDSEAVDKLGDNSEELNKLEDQLSRAFTELQQKEAEYYARKISNLATFYDLSEAVRLAKESESKGRVTGEQMAALQEASEKKRSELQQKEAEYYARKIEAAESQEEIDGIQNRIANSLARERMTDESAQQLESAIAARRPTLPEKIEEKPAE